MTMLTISSKIDAKVGGGSFRGSTVTVPLITAVDCSLRNLQIVNKIEYFQFETVKQLHSLDFTEIKILLHPFAS